MRNVVITHDDDVRTFLAQIFDPMQKVIQKTHFELLSLGSRTTVGKVTIQNCQIAQIRSNHSTFIVVLWNAQAFVDFSWLFFGERRNTAVPFSLG